MNTLVGCIRKRPLQEQGGEIEAMVARVSRSSGDRVEQVSLAGSLLQLAAVVRGRDAKDGVTWNQHRNMCVLMTGECFGEEDSLEPKALLELYEEEGRDFCDQLNGAFTGVFVDLRREEPQLYLFNDRYGLERMYWHDTGETLYFASEAKALLTVLPEARNLDVRAIGEMFTCGCVLENRSLFQGVEILPPASLWTWQEKKGWHRGSYFSPSEWESLPALASEEFYERLKETFRRVVPRYCAEEEGLALSITGGLDSRMVLAAMEAGPGSIPCYTFGGMYRECADVKVGRDVCDTVDLNHRVLSLEKRFFEDFSDLATQTIVETDGAMDVTGSANLWLNRLAREVAPVRLTGNYGGEILRGIVGLKSHRFDTAVLAPELRVEVERAKSTLAKESKGSLPGFIAFKQVPWFHHAMYALERSQVRVRTPFLDRELVALSHQAPSECRLNKSMAFQLVADCDPRLASLPNDRGAVWSPQGDLTKSRSLIDKISQEFLPRAEYLFDYGMPRWFAPVDRLLSPLRPERLFLGHQKFCHFRIWYRRELSSFVRDVLLDSKTLSRSFYDREYVENVVNEHLKGTSNHTLTLHKLLSLELTQRTLLDHN